MCKLIQRSSMLCMSVLLAVLMSAVPVQAQENSPGFSPDRSVMCYTETKIIERCYSWDGLEIGVYEEHEVLLCV